MTDRQKKISTLIGLAEMYGDHLTETRINAYLKVLEDLSPEDVELAAKQILQNPQIIRFPLPAIFLEQVRPTLSAEQAANELLARAISAIGIYGYYDCHGARQYLGEAAWRAMPGDEGWRDFCLAGDPERQTSTTTARAQLRDRMAANLRMQSPGGRVALPAPGNAPFRVFVPHTTSQDEKRVEDLKKQLSGEITKALPSRDSIQSLKILLDTEKPN